MKFSEEQLEQLKILLKEQRKEISADTDKKITSAVTKLERKLKTHILITVAKLEGALEYKIKTVDLNLRQEIKKLEKKFERRFDKVDRSIIALGKEILKSTGQLYENHDMRITNMERYLHIIS